MGKGSGRREIYFQKNCVGAKTPEEYLLALRNSPFRTHRRMYEALQTQYQQLKDAE